MHLDRTHHPAGIRQVHVVAGGWIGRQQLDDEIGQGAGLELGTYLGIRRSERHRIDERAEMQPRTAHDHCDGAAGLDRVQGPPSCRLELDHRVFH